MTSGTSQLSERELETLRLVAQGRTNQQIAHDLGISINTVKVHLRNIFGKIGVASRVEATMYAVRMGLVSIEQATATVAETEELVSEQSVAATGANVMPAVAANVEAEANGSGQTVTPNVATSSNTPVIRNRVNQNVIATSLLAGIVVVGFLLVWLLYKPADPPTGGSPNDPVTNFDVVIGVPVLQWVPRLAFPGPLSGAAATSFAGNVYVIGGKSDGKVTDAIVRFDPERNIWTPLRAKPTAVAEAHAVVLNGKIYVPGGQDANGKPTDKLEIYDQVSATWSQGASLPAARSAYGLTSFEGRLYLAGGWDGTEARAEVFVFDPGSDSWSELPPMPTARQYPGVVEVDGNLYVVGGEDARGQALATNEVYTPVSQGWGSRAPLIEARSRFGIGNFGNLVYVFGGSDEKQPIRYDIRADNWQLARAPDAPVGLQPAVAERDLSLFVIAGSDDETASRVWELRQLYQIPVDLSQPQNP